MEYSATIESGYEDEFGNWIGNGDIVPADESFSVIDENGNEVPYENNAFEELQETVEQVQEETSSGNVTLATIHFDLLIIIFLLIVFWATDKVRLAFRAISTKKSDI